MTARYFIDRDHGTAFLCVTEAELALATLGGWIESKCHDICWCGVLVQAEGATHEPDGHRQALPTCNVGLLVEHACRSLAGAL